MHVIIVFPRYSNIPTGTPPPITGASNAGGVTKISILSQYLAQSSAVNGSTAKCNAATDRDKFMTLVAVKWRRLFLTGDRDEV